MALSLKNCDATASAQYSGNLRSIEQALVNEPWPPDTPVSVVILQPYLLHHGEAFSPLGLIGLQAHYVSTGMDDAIVSALVHHERAHIAIGSELRKAIRKHHAPFDDFFSQEILPAWKQGNISLSPDENYIREKNWNGLYPLWTTAGDITAPHAQEALINYFALLERGLIAVTDGVIQYHGSPLSPKLWDMMMQNPPQSPQSLYQHAPQEYTTAFLTGYALAKYFHESVRNALSRSLSCDLWELEEGFANFIGTAIAGVSLEQLNRVAPQDESKIRWAKKISEKNNRPVSAVIAQVNSYETLAEFYKELGII